jgi:hypothetical protein
VNVSPGHAPDAPVQFSAGSQTPADSRHTVVDAVNVLPGHAADVPVQFSAGSHTPVEARQDTVDAVNVSPGHAPDAPVQFSGGSHTPADARQVTVDAVSVSPGHAPLDPVHCSGGSQTPEDERHTTAPEFIVSVGHVPLVPVQRSAGSQTPVEPRQMTVVGVNGNVHPKPSAFGLLGSQTLLVQTSSSMHSALVVHCGISSVVSVSSQLHFDLVPGSASWGPAQSLLLELCLQVVHVLMSKNPSPLVSEHVAVTLVTGIPTVWLLATSPQTTPSCVPPASAGSMIVTVQSSAVDSSAFGPM